jgi:hypothetical protein
MISDWCAKCRKPVVYCLCLAVSAVGFAKVDPVVKPLPAHAVEVTLTATTSGTSEAGQIVVHNQVTGQRIVAMWPDQRGQAIFPPMPVLPLSSSGDVNSWD